MKIKEKFQKKLLVEGNDDRHVIWALCEKFAIVENFDVVDCEGIDSLMSQLPVRFKQSGVETIGIIIDADTNITNRWNTISQLLSTRGYRTPETLPSEGLIIKQNSITVGIWIMPNNNLNGMIEDFIKFLVPKEDKLLEFADTSLNNIEATGLHKYNINHRSKALIHTWLSWREDPGTPMGLSITKKYLSTESEICKAFINWLQLLFG